MYLQLSTVPACYGRESKHQSIMGSFGPIYDVHRQAFLALGLGDPSDYDVIDLVSSDEEVVEEDPPLPEGEEEVPVPPLVVQQEQQVPVGPTEGDEMQQGEDVVVPPPGDFVEPSTGPRRGGVEAGDNAPTLGRVFPRVPLARPMAGNLPRFAPNVGPSDPFAHDAELNHPSRMDLDAACFCMLTRDLPELFGIMARPANRRVKIRDVPGLFDDWLHVVSDPIVVRVYAGRDREERDRFRFDLVELLRVQLGMTLTCSNDSHTLSRNQVNVSVSAMSQALHALGARICRASFFGMKWRLSEAEPILDRFIDRYREEMGASVPVQKNLFDYGVRFHTDDLVLYSFSEAQRRAKRFTDGVVHLMCNSSQHGSLEFTPVGDGRITGVKLYQELCHELLSVIQKQMLDHIPTTMASIRSRLHQLQDLMERWRGMTDEMRASRFTGMRIELTVQSERVIDGRRAGSELDLFRLEGIERALGGAFVTHHEGIGDFLSTAEGFVSGFAECVHGRNERSPSVEIRSALTLARSAIGWSGKFMEQQMRDALAWADAATAEEERRVQAVEGLGFTYDGVELDSPDVRPLIRDFLDHAEWFLHHRVRDRSIPGMMLKERNSNKFLPKKGIYVDRVGAARHYTRLYGVGWRASVRSI